jgi:methionyl-tRNA formyltransferase
MGTPEFAVPSLHTLLSTGYSVPAVVTAPDKPRGRGQEYSPTPVKEFALRHRLPILQPVSLKDPSFADEVSALHPDLIVVVAFRILPRQVFTIPRLGSFNLHASLLPKYRGAAPINWAIINGEKETGVTTFLLQDKVDTGEILLQERIPIGPEDDAGSVHDTLSALGATVVLRTVQLLEQGTIHPQRQNDALASPAPKISKDDCRINWDQEAISIYNRIRGLSPTPAAFTSHRGKLLKIFKAAHLDQGALGEPGRVSVSPDTLHVATKDSMIAILELQQEGKKRMRIAEFLRGYRISSGEQFK